MEMTDLVATRHVQTSFELGPLARPAINWYSAERVREVLEERGVDLPDTEEDTLYANLARDELISKVLAYREAAKRANSYGPVFLEKHGRLSR